MCYIVCNLYVHEQVLHNSSNLNVNHTSKSSNLTAVLSKLVKTVTTQTVLCFTLGFQWQRMVFTITIGAKLKSRKRQLFSAERGIPGFLSQTGFLFLTQTHTHIHAIPTGAQNLQCIHSSLRSPTGTIAIVPHA